MNCRGNGVEHWVNTQGGNGCSDGGRVKLLLDTFLIDAKYDAVTQEGGDFVYKLGGEGLLQ
jgi:hypothetical protein